MIYFKSCLTVLWQSHSFVSSWKMKKAVLICSLISLILCGANVDEVTAPQEVPCDTFTTNRCSFVDKDLKQIRASINMTSENVGRIHLVMPVKYDEFLLQAVSNNERVGDFITVDGDFVGSCLEYSVFKNPDAAFEHDSGFYVDYRRSPSANFSTIYIGIRSHQEGCYMWTRLMNLTRNDSQVEFVDILLDMSANSTNATNPNETIVRQAATSTRDNGKHQVRSEEMHQKVYDLRSYQNTSQMNLSEAFIYQENVSLNLINISVQPFTSIDYIILNSTENNSSAALPRYICFNLKPYLQSRKIDIHDAGVNCQNITLLSNSSLAVDNNSTMCTDDNDDVNFGEKDSAHDSHNLDSVERVECNESMESQKGYVRDDSSVHNDASASLNVTNEERLIIEGNLNSSSLTDQSPIQNVSLPNKEELKQHTNNSVHVNVITYDLAHRELTFSEDELNETRGCNYTVDEFLNSTCHFACFDFDERLLMENATDFSSLNINNLINFAYANICHSLDLYNESTHYIFHYYLNESIFENKRTSNASIDEVIIALNETIKNCTATTGPISENNTVTKPTSDGVAGGSDDWNEGGSTVQVNVNEMDGSQMDFS